MFGITISITLQDLLVKAIVTGQNDLPHLTKKLGKSGGGHLR